MTDGQAKDRAGVRIFPPAAPLVTVLGGLVLQWAFPLTFPLALAPWARYAIGGAIIVGAVYFFGFRAVRIMRRSGQSENPYKPTTSLIGEGPYRLTRNPMYLQMVIACIGFAILLANSWIALLTPLCWLALDRLVIRQEEAYLAGKFGEPYREYMRRVRRWL